MIYTTNYKNFKKSKHYVGVSISGDKGKQENFEGEFIRELAPKRIWWQEWHDNIGKVSFEDNLAFYVKSYYETNLSHLDPETIYAALDDKFVLCYEDAEEFCHRQILAAWLELMLGVKVEEVIFNSISKKEVVPRNQYYDDIKKLLESLIKENFPMGEFECVAAAYAYKKYLYYENHRDIANSLNIDVDKYKERALQLEEEYKQKRI